MHSTRRDILKLGATAAASALVSPAFSGTAFAAYKKLPIGTQLWCVRKELATDVPGTLKALGALGFDGVELENAFGKSGKEWRTHLDAAKLKPCGFHHRLDELQGDALAASLEFNQAIGNDKLIIRSFPKETYMSADAVKKVAAAVNEVADKVRSHKMRVGYHNHTTDFNRIGGEYLVEPVCRRHGEGRDPAVRHRERVGDGRRADCRFDQAQRGPHRVDAREAALEEGPQGLHRIRRARLAGHHDGERDRRRPRVVHHRVPD